MDNTMKQSQEAHVTVTAEHLEGREDETKPQHNSISLQQNPKGFGIRSKSSRN